MSKPKVRGGKKKYSRRHKWYGAMMIELTAAWDATRTTPLTEIRKARKKPAHTSDVRWRIELRRRRNADYYAFCGCIP